MKFFKQRQESILEDHTDRLRCVAVTTHNKYVISCSDDNTIRLWNLLKKTQETIVENHILNK